MHPMVPRASLRLTIETRLRICKYARKFVCTVHRDALKIRCVPRPIRVYTLNLNASWNGQNLPSRLHARNSWFLLASLRNRDFNSSFPIGKKVLVGRGAEVSMLERAFLFVHVRCLFSPNILRFELLLVANQMQFANDWFRKRRKYIFNILADIVRCHISMNILANHFYEWLIAWT